MRLDDWEDGFTDPSTDRSKSRRIEEEDDWFAALFRRPEETEYFELNDTVDRLLVDAKVFLTVQIDPE